MSTNTIGIEELGISPTLFWDVDWSKLEIHRDRFYIVPRVVHRGSIEEFKAIEKELSTDELIEALTISRELPSRVVTFFSAYFDLPVESFRSYHINNDPNSVWVY